MARLQEKLESAAGRKGVLSLRGAAPASVAKGVEERRSLNTQVAETRLSEANPDPNPDPNPSPNPNPNPNQVAETRLSEAMHLNKQLEMCITELRIERKGVLGKKRRAEEQEKLMALTLTLALTLAPNPNPDPDPNPNPNTPTLTLALTLTLTVSRRS